MTLEQKMNKRIQKIEDDKMYNPYEIVKLGVILNMKFEPTLDRVYKMIKNKRVPLVNMGSDTQPRWFVQGKDLKTYVKSKFIKN